MIKLKNPREIEKIAHSGKITAVSLTKVLKNVKPGITTLKLDRIAEEEVKKNNAESAFKKVPGYNFTICVSLNDQVVHGPPSNYQLNKGDILGIDIGAVKGGYFADMATTVLVGKEKDCKDLNIPKFLKSGEEALEKAIKEARVGNHIGDISYAIQTNIESCGYSVVKEFIGHGIGSWLHEEPSIPGIGEKGKGPVIEEGLVIAIEVIYNMGKSDVNILDDGWTVVTADKKPSGLFEHTIAVTRKGPVVLTNS